MEKFYYSKEGKTIIYQIGEYLYTIKGKPVAFLSEGAVFTINGHLLGYYGDGWIRDKRNNAVMFTDNCSGAGSIPA